MRTTVYACRLGQLFQNCNRLSWIKAERFREVQEFRNVNPALAAFEPGHEGLILAKSRSQVGLRQARGYSLLDEEVDQRLVAR